MKSVVLKGESSTCDLSFTNRSKMRISFLEREKKRTINYIADLESTLLINKAIIRDLCDSENISKNVKSALAKLNDENSMLQEKIKELREENKSSLDKILILEQVLEEYKVKAQEQINELREKNRELVEQLSLKEYHLQLFEKRCNDAELIILRYLNKIPEALQAVKDINEPIKQGVNITNVVVQNSEMKNRIQELTNELNKLRRDTSIHEMKQMKAILKEKIQSLTNENEGQRVKLNEQAKMNQELYGLNEKLSEQLKNLNKQMSALMHGKLIVHTEANVQKEKISSKELINATEVPKGNDNEFGSLSSISDNGDEPYVIHDIDPQKLLEKKDIS